MEANFDELIARNRERVAQKTAIPDKLPIQNPLPAKGGRESFPESSVTVSGLLAELGLLAPELAPQWYEVLEHLAKWNADFSYAVDNVVQLGNTPYEIYFNDSVSEEEAKKMRLHLKIKSKTWYAYAGGLNSLINDLLAQTAVTGCVSSEMVPSITLDGIDKCVLVGVKNIRFRYENEKDTYMPYQQVPNGIIVGLAANGNTIPLNPVTYKYIASRRYSEKPYAVPPFLAALEQIQLEKFMVEGMKNIIKRFGVMGFMSVLVKAPARMSGTGETDQAYQDRCMSYLNQILPEMEKGLSKGFVAGFQGTHDFDMEKVDTNVDGTKELFEINDVKKMAGFKQDPLMFGRNFSTTETLGRVILAKMTSQVGNYQLMVKTFLEDLFYQELALFGFNLKYVEVEFEEPMIGDENRKEEAFTKKLANAITLYNEGLIDQDTKAQYVGLDKAAFPEPIQRKSPLLAEEDPDEEGDKKKPKPGKKKDVTDEGGQKASNARDREYILLRGDVLEYEYECSCGCDHGLPALNFAKTGGDSLEDFISKYFKDTKMNFDAATKKLTVEIAEKLSTLGAGAQPQQVTDAVVTSLFKGWRTHFTPTQKKIVEKWVKAAYEAFRTDMSVLPSGKDMKAVFSPMDRRTMDYYKNSDRLYLGKFITDMDLRKKITAYIKEEYIENRASIGEDEAIEKFRGKFGEIMEGQSWKIAMIIQTTVNKMRNTAAISYMAQAEVEEYEIRGVVDRLQCAYCAFMQGKRFKVGKAIEHFDQLSKSDPELIKFDSPFITSLYKPDELEGVTVEMLQSQGVHAPAFHPRCRDQAVAVL